MFNRRVLALIGSLTRREIRQRYLASAGGLFWAIALPLATLGIYAFVFTQIFQARFPGHEEVGFVPYLALGLWPWFALSESVTRAATVITDNEALIGKVALPHEVLVVSSVLATFLLHLLGFVVVAIVLALSGVTFSLIGIPAAIWTFLMVLILALALAFVAAATQVFIRDLSHALGPLFLLWFFATPILYPVSMIPQPFRDWLALNPAAMMIQPIRDGLVGGGYAYSMVDLGLLVGGVLLLFLACAYFARLSRRFEDYL